jgi:hypothetical protein
MTTRCRHNTYTTRTTCFTGPVSASRQNQAAHGGITERDTCRRCGATRATNVNGVHVERGSWCPPGQDGGAS